MSKETVFLVRKPVLLFSIIMANLIIANISLFLLNCLWVGVVFLFILAIFLSAIIRDKNKHRVREDYPYTFSQKTAKIIPVELNQQRLVWPEDLSGDTILLRCRLKSRLIGWLRDPKVVINFQNARFTQTIERASKGIRFINLSSLVEQGILAGNEVHLMGIHLKIEEENAAIISFTNPVSERQRLLIIAPHPDDAELAAYGLYSKHESYIVNLTAGDYIHSDSAQHIFYNTADTEKIQLWQGKLRSFDSIFVPRWGNVDIKHCVNLGYPDGYLHQLAKDPNAKLNEKQRRAMSCFRQYNTAEWLEQKVLPEFIDWSCLVNELIHIIENIQPSVIICPHPIIDKHLDHRYTTHAILSALSKSQHSVLAIYCYQIHIAASRIAPFGDIEDYISVPPLLAPVGDNLKIYSYPLSADQIQEKAFALEMMHDLRKVLGFAPVRIKQYIAALASFINGRKITPYGDNDLYRRAVRPNELFISYSPEEMLKCYLDPDKMILPALNALMPFRCQDKAVFEYLKRCSGEIYRKVKNRETKAITYRQEDYFVKLHEGIKYSEFFKNIIRGHLPVFSASLEWKAILRCQEAHILTTPLVCYGKWGVLSKQRSFILTRALHEKISLETVGESWQKNPPPLYIKRQVIRAVAKTARRFHGQNLVHRDFYLCHFLVPQAVLSMNTSLPELPIYIIDLHRAKIRWFFKNASLIKDLGALLFSALDYPLTDRDYLYFIKYYEGGRLRQMKNREIFWRKVINRGRKIYYREYGHFPQRALSI